MCWTEFIAGTNNNRGRLDKIPGKTFFGSNTIRCRLEAQKGFVLEEKNSHVRVSLCVQLKKNLWTEFITVTNYNREVG